MMSFLIIQSSILIVLCLLGGKYAYKQVQYLGIPLDNYGTQRVSSKINVLHAVKQLHGGALKY